MEKTLKTSIIILLIYMAIIFWISTLPNTSPVLGVGITLSQATKHFIEFSILGLLVANVILRFNHTPKLNISFSIFTAIFYGISDEIHQYFVPTRWCTIEDMLIDSLGVICGVFIYLAITSKPIIKAKDKITNVIYTIILVAGLFIMISPLPEGTIILSFALSMIGFKFANNIYFSKLTYIITFPITLIMIKKLHLIEKFKKQYNKIKGKDLEEK